MKNAVQPFWKPLPAGFALGVVVLLTFVLTGHGVNVSGFMAHITAWCMNLLAPVSTQWNDYLGPLLAAWIPAEDWTTWEIIGILCGAFVASLSARRFRIGTDGLRGATRTSRLMAAFVGGAMAGFGARLANGCTASVGLSGASTLATAGFLFLIGFFTAGLLTAWLLRRRRGT